MTLRKKTFVIIGLTLLALVAAALTIAVIILSRSFASLERQRATQNVQRVSAALGDKIDALDRLVDDYAEWDDTYNYVNDSNQAFIDDNFHDSNFIDLKNSLVLILNNEGQLIYGKAFDLDKQQAIPLPEGLQPHLVRNSLLVYHPALDHKVAGLLHLPEGSHIISSHPVLTSEDLGPINGTFIMGFPFDETAIAGLATLTDLPLTLYDLENEELPTDLQPTLSILLSGQQVVLQPQGQNLMQGYSLLYDIYGDPALLLQVNMPRDIYRQGQTNLLYLFISLLVVGLVFIGVVLVLLERLVLARLAYLSTAVEEIGHSGNLTKRVELEGKDELARLAADINGMLEALLNSQTELQKAKETAEAANTAKTDFISLVTHELRLPVTVIRGFSDLMLTQPAAITDTQNFANIIRSNADRMGTLISDLADVSRIESGHLLLNFDHVLLPGVLEEIVRSLKRQIEERKQTLVLQIPDDLPALWGDRTRLSQIMMNLVSNASKYTGENGRIAVWASSEQVNGASSMIHISVQDTGVGMQPEDQQHIFEKFFRSEDEKVRKVHGTGLGLHITRSLVEMQNGRIWFESEYGRGTAFHITFPVVSAT